MKRHHIFLFLQVAVAVGIFYLIFRSINIHDAIVHMRTAIPIYLGMAFLLLMVQMVCGALRWIQWIKIAGLHPPIGKFISVFTAGSFINSAVPGGIGGDAMRVWMTVRHGATLKVSMYIILLDRIVSIVGIGLLVLSFGAIRFFVIGATPQPIDMIALMVASGAVGAMIFLILLNPLLVRCPFKLPRIFTIPRELSRLMGDIIHYPRKALFLGLFLMLTHIFTILALLCLAKAMHVAITAFDIFSSVPSALMLASIPITPGGWGVREGSMVLMLKQFGVTAEVALSMSVLFGLFLILSHLPLILLYRLRKNDARMLADTSEQGKS
jgi:glycosyltransferase 2 family protein